MSATYCYFGNISGSGARLYNTPTSAVSGIASDRIISVDCFSQPLVLTGAPDEVVISISMRFANIIRLNEAGEREVVSMRWGFAGKVRREPIPTEAHARAL